MKTPQRFFNTPDDGTAGGVAFNPFEAANTSGHPIQGEPNASATQGAGSTTGGSTTTAAPVTTSTSPGGTPAVTGTPTTVPTTGAGVQAGPEGQQPVTTAQPAAPAATPGLTLSEQQFAQLMQSVAPARQQGQPAPQLTQEEIDKKFNVIRPNEEQLTKIFRGGPEGVQTLTEVLHGAAHMGAVIASHHSVQQVQKLWDHIQQTYGPVRQVAEQTQQDQYQKQFFNEYNGFTETDRPVLMSVYNTLVQEGFKGTPQQAMSEVAKRGEAIIKTYNPNFVAKQIAQGQAGQQQAGTVNGSTGQTQQAPRMASLTMSAGPGSGAVGHAAEDTTQGSGLAKSVFGRLG